MINNKMLTDDSINEFENIFNLEIKKNEIKNLSLESFILLKFKNLIKESDQKHFNEEQLSWSFENGFLNRIRENDINLNIAFGSNCIIDFNCTPDGFKLLYLKTDDYFEILKNSNINYITIEIFMTFNVFKKYKNVHSYYHCNSNISLINKIYDIQPKSNNYKIIKIIKDYISVFGYLDIDKLNIYLIKKYIESLHDVYFVQIICNDTDSFKKLLNFESVVFILAKNYFDDLKDYQTDILNNINIDFDLYLDKCKETVKIDKLSNKIILDNLYDCNKEKIKEHLTLFGDYYNPEMKKKVDDFLLS